MERIRALLAGSIPPEFGRLAQMQALWLSENQLATGGDDEAAEECMPEDYESWTMKQIRKELKERGVDVGAECRGCSEKREFIEVLCRHM